VETHTPWHTTPWHTGLQIVNSHLQVAFSPNWKIDRIVPIMAQ
jgi:hypothetical protein